MQSNETHSDISLILTLTLSLSRTVIQALEWAVSAREREGLLLEEILQLKATHTREASISQEMILILTLTLTLTLIGGIYKPRDDSGL